MTRQCCMSKCLHCRTKFLIQNPRIHLPCNAVVCTLAFGLALPVAIALFPQISTVGYIRVVFPTENITGLSRRVVL